MLIFFLIFTLKMKKMEKQIKVYDVSLDIERAKLSLDRRKVLNDTLSTLENLLTATKPISEGFGETKWEPALSDDSMGIIEKKIMELVKKI